MNRILLAAFASLFLSCSSGSFKQDIKVSDSATGFLEKVDSIVTNKMNQYNIPGLAIGIVRNDSIILAKGYGVRNIENNKPVTENSIFHTASISKLFTAEAVMQLVAQKVITLDDTLIDLVPELNYSDKRVEDITIKNLLNHTSGCPDISNYHWNNNNQLDDSLKDFILGLDLKLDADPNAEYQYSNLAFDILGYVIEKVSNTTFDDFLKENVLNKNGMYTSDFRYFKIPDSLKTAPHTKSWITKNIQLRETYPYTREHAPSSTLNSSAKELNSWMLGFLKKINSPNSQNIFNEMLSPSIENQHHIGLGFQLYDFDSIKAVGHFGGDKGFRSFLMMIPDEKIGLVLMGNCDYDEDYRQEIIFPLAKLMLTKNKHH